MGAIAAAFDKKGTNAPSTVATMLKELAHRGTTTPKIVGQPSTFITQSMDTLTKGRTYSKTAVGTNSSEPILGENCIWIFEGQHFHPKASIIHQIIHATRHQPLKIARHILKDIDGSYTFAVAFPNKILVGRDTMGTSPLYYGENQTISAIASERKSLWKIGILNTQSFPPGNLATMNQKGFTFEPVSILKQPPQKKIKIFEAAKHLQKLLEESTRERVSDVDRVAVAFSGGLDSSIVAVLTKLTGVSTQLISVGLEGQSEIETAKDAAETLELPLTLQTYTLADVESILPKVLWLMEEPDPMKVGVAIPIFWSAQVAARLRYRVLLAGQGADELFGGYHRYLTIYAKSGAEKVRQALYNDTAISYKTNFQRDQPVCAYHKIELRLPFVDTKVVRFALSLPINLKIKSAQDNIRKRVLRQVAKNLGIPASIANKPKRAVQFATGVDKALKKLAKREGLTQHSYINKVFREVYPNSEVKQK